MTTTIPVVSLDCATAVMEKAMSVPMGQFGTEVLEEMIKDQPHLIKMISFLLTELIAKDKDEETAAVDAVQTMAVIGLVFKAIKTQIEADEMEMSEDWA
jgi:hypothetical protein